MELKISDPFWQVIGMGALTGMRSTAAPVIASHILSHHQSKNFDRSPLKFMQSVNVSSALKLFALGELIGDKLPFTPDRIKPVAVTARVLSGALAGASIYEAKGDKPILGALLGGAAALASTYFSFYIRKNSARTVNLLDPVIGSIEDALVIGSGIELARAA